MIDNLVILNYKSAKEVQMSCKKMNVIIGQPNTGKSNILEALGLFTLFNNECKIQELVRFQTMHNLFYDNNIENPIHIRTNSHRMKIQFKENFEVDIETKMGTTIKSYELYYDQSGKLLNSHPHYTSPVNLYKFRPENVFANKGSAHLRPPHGDNLVLMLMKNNGLRRQAGEVFSEFGYKFVVNPMDSSIQIMKEVEGIVITHPYTMASHMLQRYVFHLAAIETNKNSIIIFEEPESYASSAFTWKIAEKIAQDTSNQFFISSHNPNFLVTILNKMPIEDVKLYYATYENYQTQLKALIEEDYELILRQEMDVLDKLGERMVDRL
jgi:AAA15 family ATPase/GTPase